MSTSLTRQDVIRILRGYRRAAMIVMEGYVILDFDIETKEILIFRSTNSERYAFVLGREQYTKHELPDKVSAAAWMQVVHDWLSVLTNEQAACLFYRYISRERWTYREVGEKLGVQWWSVPRMCSNAISQILRYNNSRYREHLQERGCAPDRTTLQKEEGEYDQGDERCGYAT